MAKVEVKNLEGETVKELELVDEVFATPPNQSLLWEATKVYLASQRRGTHSTKSRGEVSGGGKKPWRQKGTGRARAGSIRSSLWRHGSIAHGPKPRDYSYKIPKQMLRGALRSALAAKFQDQKLTVVDQSTFRKRRPRGLPALCASWEQGSPCWWSAKTQTATWNSPRATSGVATWSGTTRFTPTKSSATNGC